MSHDSSSSYYEQMRHADEQLDDALLAIRAEQDAGRLSPADAAAERCELLERHIAESRALRRGISGMREIPAWKPSSK